MNIQTRVHVPGRAWPCRSSIVWATLIAPLAFAADPNGQSGTPVVSSDGKAVVFDSQATNFVRDDYNRLTDIFVYERDSGLVTRLHESDRGSYHHSVSTDARFVTFQSTDPELVPGDTNNYDDVFRIDRASGAITRVSVGSTGVEGDDRSTYSSISGNGQFVAFESYSTNLVPGDTGSGDIFLHDALTGTTTDLTQYGHGPAGTPDSYQPVISEDGRYVAYSSQARALVPGDTNGAGDVFVYSRETGETARVSVSSSGVESNGYSGGAAISADGRYVAFASGASNLVSGDTNGVWDVFVHDRLTGSTTRVSVSSNGAQANGESFSLNPKKLSADGRMVVFHSAASNLVPGDTNGVLDVFVHDRVTGETLRASVGEAGAQGDDDSAAPSISGDGTVVAFNSTATNLTGTADLNGMPDVFVRNLATRETVRIEALPPDDEPVTAWLRTQGGVTTTGNRIDYSGSPRGWWNGAYSSSLSSLGYTEENGYEVRFHIDSIGNDPSGEKWVAGLGTVESGTDWTDIEFGFRYAQGKLEIRESGILKAGGLALSQGDVLAIRVSRDSINDLGYLDYRQNGQSVYQSAFVRPWAYTAAESPLYVDTAFREGAALALSVTVAGQKQDPPSRRPLTDWLAPSGDVVLMGNQLVFDGAPSGGTDSINSVALSTLGYTDYFDPIDPDQPFSDDYELRFMIDSEPGGTTWVVGLGASENDTSPNDIEFGLRADDGVLSVRENGTWRAGGTRLAMGDVVSLFVGGVTRNGEGRVEYRHNGVPVYSTTYTGSPPFYVDTAFLAGPVALSVAVDGVPKTLPAPDPVTAWTGAAGGVATDGNRIVHTGPEAGWSGTVNSVSLASLGFSDDYELRFTLGATPDGTTWVVGLGTAEGGADWRDIEYGLRSSGGAPEVRENGEWRKGGTALAAGDVLSLLVSNGSIQYRHNGVPLYTRAHSGTATLYVDTAFQAGAMVIDVDVARCETPECAGN